MTIPEITLRDGVKIPQVGFGTMDLAPQRDNSAASHEITAQAVSLALEAGYRHFDTAQMYANEAGLGLALANSTLPRAELFLTSKLSNANHRPDDVRRSVEQTLVHLGVDHLDLFLMHWPVPTLYDGDYVSTWRAMIQLVEEGLLRSVGVSNFQPEHLAKIIDETGHVPSVNQIQVHPYYSHRALFDVCDTHDIAIEAWSPLGQSTVLADEKIISLAKKYGREPADIVLRWHIQQNRIIIPKTATPERMKTNISIFDFILSEQDMSIIDSLNQGESGRRGPDPYTFDWIPD